MVNRLDIPHLRKVGRSLRSTLRALRLVSQYALQRLRAPRGTTLHLGNALAARLYASLLKRNVEIMFGANVEQLLIEGDAVKGVTIRDSSGSRTIVARKGVVLATGGFSHDARLREQFFPAGAGAVSATAPAGTGDGLHVATAAGASINTRVASPAYWVPASLFKRADGSQGVFPHTVTDRAKPGIIAVNAAGRRFVNEALSYHEFVLAMLRDGNDAANRSFYLVCDRRFLWNYGLGRIQPFTVHVRRYVRSGELIEARSIEALAERHRRRKIGAGKDPGELQRIRPHRHRPGIRPRRLDLSASSRRCRPFAESLRRADRAAAVLRACGLFRRISARRSACGRMAMPAFCREDGSVIAGLYACGNDMGSIMNGNYPGPGITLGPALTFGYIAGRHLAQSRQGRGQA